MHQKRLLMILSLMMIGSVLATACARPTPEIQVEEKVVTEEVPVEITKVVEKVVAPDEVKVGVVYPLTGPGGEFGFKTRIAVELAEDIINHPYPELGDFPFAVTEGLPNLNGARWRVLFGDHQGNAEIGTTEVERLITEENVVMLSGNWYSGVTIAARVVAERYGIPMINDVSSARKLNEEREELGLEWYFSQTFDDYDNSLVFFNILDDLRARGEDINTVALLHTDDTRGMSMATDLTNIAADRGYEIVLDIAYPTSAADLTAEVLALKEVGPDVVFLSVSPEQGISYLRISKDLNFNPKYLQGGVGISSPVILEELGEDANYILSREAFSLDLAEAMERPELIAINDLYRERSGGIDLDADAARGFQGQFVMATIVNNAGSTDPEALRQAAQELDMSADQLITPWDCIRFDPVTGKNVCARSVIVQAIDGKFRLVWPWDLAPVDLVYPWPKWDER